MWNRLTEKTKRIIYLIPLTILCLYFFVSGLSYDLHDFMNSYVPALLVHEGIPPEQVLFDICDFNYYAWNHGFKDVLLDFYLNSPFNATLFYPLTFLSDPYIAKAIFNGVGILLFLISVYHLTSHYLEDKYWILVLLPVLFFVPIRNQIHFGQSYFVVLSLVVLGYVYVVRKREVLGAGLLGVAVLIKFFPLFYGIPLLVNGRWRAIIVGGVLTVLLMLFSMYQAGFTFWEQYVFEIIPEAIANGTTIDFRSNSQSFDVFFKTVFIPDPYYNPGAFLDSEKSYLWLNWLVKSIVLGSALFLSYLKSGELLKLLAIWVVAMFLLQSKTATYAQILWIIPAFSLLGSELGNRYKVLFFVLLFLVCNFPYHLLREMPIGIRFMRLWLAVVMAILFYISISKKTDLRYMLGSFILLLPLNLSAFKPSPTSDSSYVIKRKEHFVICDFKEAEGTLTYTALGRNGPEQVKTDIPISSFDPDACRIEDNQVFFNNRQITTTKSIKKKAVLVNGCDIYFLTDHRSRRAAFTLKKTTICNN